jgi:hypothetical protein
MRIGSDRWNNHFAEAMKDWSVSYCEGASRTEKFDNLYREDIVSSVAFG